MTFEIVTPRLLLTYEPDVETLGWDGNGRCGVYYIWHNTVRAGAISMTSLARGIGEIGYELEPDFRGHGIATEAVAAVITATPRHHGFAMLYAKAYADNAPSLRVLSKTGFFPVAARLCWSESEQRPMTVLAYHRLA